MAFPNTNNLPAFTQMDANQSIISPLFLGQDYMEYMNVLPDIKGVTKIDHLGSLSKITKAFTAGAFAGETTGTFSGVLLLLQELKLKLNFTLTLYSGK